MIPRGTICLLVLAVAHSAVANDHNWVLTRDRDGIQVYTRVVENSKFKAVKAVMTITASLGELVALVRDAAACTDWAALCAKAELVEILSETEGYVYTLNDLPWPISDRDVVAHVLWSQSPTDLAVTMSATVVSGKLPIEEGVVRLSYGVISWQFIPVGMGKIEIVSHAHLDPGGVTPAWLTNRLLVDSPFDTMVGMREMTNADRYKNSSFEFLSEP